MKLPKRGRARRAWLAGYAAARATHYVKQEDGYFALLEDLSADPLTLYRVDGLRAEREAGVGAYALDDRERMGVSSD